MHAPNTPPASRSVVAASLAAAAMLLVSSLTAPAAASEHDSVTPARVAGDTRFDTAAAIAGLTFADASTALIVSGRDFPDALAASYATGRVGGPILLVEHGAVPDATWQALEDLGVTSTVIVGGADAVSEVVEAELRAAGYETERVSGVDRYQTASSVAMRYGSGDPANVGTLEGHGRTAMLASGERFPDALAAGPISSFARFPLLLTPREGGEASSSFTISELDIDHVLVVGGTAAVAPVVEERLRAQGVTTERIAGETRTDTARIAAEFARQRLGWTAELSLLARGDGFADALAGSAHGGVTASPILLAQSPTTLGEPTTRFFRSACPEVEAIRALGGTSAVSQGVLAGAVDAAETCLGASDAEQDYLVAPQQVVTRDPGETQEIRISARFEDDFTGPVDVALFRCTDVTATDSPVRFADDDGDGDADRLGTTDTGAALIATENGNAVNATVVRDVGPAEDGILRIEVHSDAADCVVAVVWDDVDGDGQLRVDADRFATEPFGVTEVRWAG